MVARAGIRSPGNLPWKLAGGPFSVPGLSIVRVLAQLLLVYLVCQKLLANAVVIASSVCVCALLLQLKDVTEQITQLTEAIKAASAAVGEC